MNFPHTSKNFPFSLFKCSPFNMAQQVPTVYNTFCKGRESADKLHRLISILNYPETSVNVTLKQVTSMLKLREYKGIFCCVFFSLLFVGCVYWMLFLPISLFLYSIYLHTTKYYICELIFFYTIRKCGGT